MTGNDVYTTVNTDNGDLPEVTDDQLFNMLNQGIGDGGSAAVAVEEAKTNNWIVLDEEERQHVRALYQALLIEKEQQSKRKTTAFLTGDCMAIMTGITANIKLHLKKGQFKSSYVTLDIPGFELDIDDKAWKGKIGTLIRERFVQLFFVRSLIYKHISDALQLLVKTSFQEALIDK